MDLSGRATAIMLLVVVVYFLAFIVVPVLLIERTREDRPLAVALWIGAMALAGGLAVAVGDDDVATVATGWLVGAAGAIAAGVAAAVRRRSPALALTTAIGAIAPGVCVGVLFTSFLTLPAI